MRGILFGVCETSLQNRIEAELDYQEMVKKNILCTIKLHNLVRKDCNILTVVVVEDIIGNLIEALFNFSLSRGEDFDS